jgi:nitrite reductase (NO-forming)
MKRVTGYWLLIVLMVVLMLGGCYQTPSPTTPAPTPTPTPVATETEIRVNLRYPFFRPSAITAVKGQTVKLTVYSADRPHTFTIDELGIDIAADMGQTVTEEFTVEKAGTFTFYCAVPGHRDAGMEGTLKVTE